MSSARASDCPHMEAPPVRDTVWPMRITSSAKAAPAKKKAAKKAVKKVVKKAAKKAGKKKK